MLFLVPNPLMNIKPFGFEFSFFSFTSCSVKTIEPSFPYYVPIAERRRDGFLPFLRALECRKLQSALLRINPKNKFLGRLNNAVEIYIYALQMKIMFVCPMVQSKM